MERPNKGHRAYRVMENDDDEEDEEAILEWVQCMMTMVLLMTDGITVIDIINIKS